MFKYRFLSLILTVILLISAVGCGNKTDDAYIYFELPEVPLTLDPQIASSDTELLIVKNIFEGLMRKDADGNVVEGACKSYKNSGLTYTFTLRDDIFWNNGDAVTSQDFVYGLRRALIPETKATFASRLFSIKNAREVNSGSLSADKLGVTATNETTLEIELSYDDNSFLENLTTSVAMPCNESFFTKSAGKYGLFSDKIICNGSYRLTKWNKDSFGIRLYRNEEYTGNFRASNAAVFLTCDDDEPVTQKLEDNNIDIAFINSALADDMESKGFKTTGFQNICWVMTLSNDFSKDMRTALLKLVGSQVFGENLKSGYVEANSLYPEISGFKTDGSGTVQYDLMGGKNLFSTEVKKLKDARFPSDITLYYYDNGFIKPIITDIVGHWQNNFSAFINIEAVDNAEALLPQLKNQTLSIAVFPVKMNSKNFAEYLQNFGVTNSDLTDAQSSLLNSKNIEPIIFQNTTLCYSKSIKKISLTEDNGFIDFAFVIKEED